MVFRRLTIISAWILATAVGVPALGSLFVTGFVSPGLGHTDTAEIAALLGVALLTLVAIGYVASLGYRGRLPGTRRNGTRGAEQAGGSRFMGRIVAFVAVVVAASAVAAIVAATVVTDYVPEIYQRRFDHGEVDRVITVESEVLGETRYLRVKVPDEYDADPDRRYPVLLVLDGEWHLDHTADASSTLRWLGLGEPMIVVGVVNGVAGRTVDFVAAEHVDAPARAGEFLEFLETEALPAVDRDLRTTSERVLAGYSLGGSFVLYSLVHRPDLFVGRLALSPSLWRGDQVMVSELERFFSQSPQLHSYLYTSVGSEEMASIRDGFDALVSLLERSAPPGLGWDEAVVEGADHDNNAVRSTPSALRGYWEYRRQSRAPDEGAVAGRG